MSSDHVPADTLLVSLKARRASHMNHMMAAGLMLASAVSSITTGRAHHGPLFAAAEIAIAATLLIILFRHSRSRSRHEGRIAWAELASAAFVAFEAWQHTHNGHRHHTIFIILSYAPALMLLWLGIFQSAIARRRFVRVGDEGIEVRLPFRHVRVAWPDLERVDRDGETAVTLVLNEGRSQRISFGRLEDGAGVQRWVMERVAAYES